MSIPKFTSEEFCSLTNYEVTKLLAVYLFNFPEDHPDLANIKLDYVENYPLLLEYFLSLSEKEEGEECLCLQLHMHIYRNNFIVDIEKPIYNKEHGWGYQHCGCRAPLLGQAIAFAAALYLDMITDPIILL